MADVQTFFKQCAEFGHSFSTGPLKKIINVHSAQDCFDFTAKVNTSCTLGVTITPINRDIRFKASVRMCCSGTWYGNCALDNDHQTNEGLSCGYDLKKCGMVKFVVDFDLSEPSALQSPITADLKAFVERGSNVTLVGSDGSVTVPKRLLEIRAEALEAMFNHGTKESETMTIEMADFDSKTLDAFGHFLMTGEIKDGKETALHLAVLGDKYNLQPMKQAAETFVLKYFKELNQTQVVEVLAKVNADVLKRAMLKLSEPFCG